MRIGISVLSLLMVVVGYRVYLVINRPIPEAIKEKNNFRVLDEIGRIADALMDLSIFLGINPATPPIKFVVNSIFSLLVNGFHEHNNTDVEITDGYISGIPVRVFRPITRRRPLQYPTAIYVHGGGWTWLSVDTYTPYLANISNRTKLLIIAPEYSTTMEHAHSAGLDESINVTWSVLAGKSGFPVDKNHVIISGDGSGGNMAAHIAQRFRSKLYMQILINPSLQMFDFKTPSYQDTEESVSGVTSPGRQASHWLLHSNTNLRYKSVLVNNLHIHPTLWNSKYSQMVDSKKHLPNYLHVTKAQTLKRIYHDPIVAMAMRDVVTNITLSPMMNEDLIGVPNAYVITSQYDVLRDEAIMYTNRLQEAGVKIKFKHYSDAFHGFLLFSHKSSPFQFSVSQTALDDLSEFIAFKVHRDILDPSFGDTIVM